MTDPDTFSDEILARDAWRFYIDRGGTFTDVVAESPDGALQSFKLLSQDPRYDDAALEAIRRCLGIDSEEAIPSSAVAELRMGTTVATNALLERKGERVVLVTTRGFRDQLRIGYQHRPKLFVLKIELPDMLYTGVIEADERVSASGEVLRSLDEEELRRDLDAARAQGFEACAIVFLHGYRYPGARSARSGARPRRRLHADLRQPRDRAADEICGPRRHDGGRRVSLACAVALCRPHRERAGRAARDFSS